MNNDLLSVIVLAYKNGDYLLKTLDSVFLQDYDNMELIISDDGDPNFDKSRIEEYVRQHAKSNIKNVQIIVNENNLGTVRNINKALKAAAGKYIKAIAGDDVFSNMQVFKRQVEYLRHNENALFVVGNTVECDGELKEIRTIGFAPNGKEYLLASKRSKLLRCICKKYPGLLAIQASCFTKHFFEQYGLFDERLKLIEDLPMAVRIVINNITIGYIDYPCVQHRGSTGISTSKSVFDNKRMSYYLDLERYFELVLGPISAVIGHTFVKMRLRLCRFRIDYSNLQAKGETKKKLVLLVKNIWPIIYYIVTNTSGMIFHLWS